MLVALALLAARNRLPTGFADAPAALREAMAALVRGVLGLAMGATFVVSVVALLVGSGVTAVSFVWRRPARLQVARQTERLPEGAPAATPPTRATRGPQTLPMPAAPQDSSAAPEEGERPKGLFG
jgi:hypothetical protein